MPNWIENLFKGRVSTFHLLVTMIVFAYVFHSAFVVVYVLTNATKLDKDLMRVVFDIGQQHKEILVFALGYFIKTKVDENAAKS